MVVQEDKKTLAMIMIVSFSFFNPLSTSPANAEAPLFIVGQEADDRKDAELAIRRSHNETWIDQLLMKLFGLISLQLSLSGISRPPV